VLAPGIGQALIGAGGDRAGAGLLGLVVQLPLPGLHPGLDGPAGDRRRHAAGTAAGSVQAGTATTVAKAADGQVEMIRSLRLVRRSAIKARTQAANQLQSLLVTAPDELREQLRRLPLDRLVDAAAKLDLGQVTTVAAASRLRCGRSPGETSSCRRRSLPWTSSWTGWSPRSRRRCWPCTASVPTLRPRC
jgi:hypothetical protein